MNARRPVNASQNDHEVTQSRRTLVAPKEEKCLFSTFRSFFVGQDRQDRFNDSAARCPAEIRAGRNEVTVNPHLEYAAPYAGRSACNGLGDENDECASMTCSRTD